MSRLASCFLLMALALRGQTTVIEDFRCRTATVATNGNPTVLTCDEPHGWDQRPSEAQVSIGTAGITNGAAVTIGGVVYTFVNTLDNEQPGQILISSNRVRTARRLTAAINDNGEEKGSGYSSATVQHPLVGALGPRYSTAGGQIDVANDWFTWFDHGLQTGDAFTWSSNSGTMTAPFSFYTVYYAIQTDADRFRVALSAEDATNGIYIDLSTTTANYLRPVLVTPRRTALIEQPGATGSVVVYLYAHDVGSPGGTITLSSSSATQLPVSRATLAKLFLVQIKGSTGSWSGLGSNSTPRSWTATVLDADRFSVPFNSTSAGSFSGQDIRMRTDKGDQGGKFWTFGEVPGLTNSVSANHAWAVTVPGCTAAMSEVECSKGYWSADNQKSYGAFGDIDSFVVAGSSITITLRAPFADAATYEPMAVERLIQIRGYQEYATANNPGYDGTANDPAQTAAALFARYSTRGFRVVTLSGDRKTITIANPGLADGTYVGTCLTGCIRGGSAHPYPHVVITWKASPYLYFSNRNVGYLFPWAYDWWNSKTPLSFDQQSNRYRFWVKFGKNMPLPSIPGATNYQWGTYPQTVSQDTVGGGSHFYHGFGLGTYKDRWQMIEFNSAPNHQVGAGGGMVWPSEPIMGHAYYPKWAGGARNYMAGHTNFYHDFGPGHSDWTGQTIYVAGIQYGKTSGEPDELVRARSIVYAPERYVSGVLTASPGYEVFFGSAPLVGLTYAVRYSTAGSIRTNGWSSGTDGGAVTPPGLAVGSTGANWQSPEMSESDDFWVGLRPIVPVQGTSGLEQSPIWVMSRVELGLEAGSTVTVTGVGGNGAANQTDAVIEAVAPRRNFYRYLPGRESGWEGAGTFNGITAASGICTATFSESHGLTPGWVVEVTGSENSTLGNMPGASPKLYTVQTVPDAQTMTFNCSSVPNGTYTLPGALTYPYAVMALPAVAVPGVSSGNHTGGGTITSTGEHAGFTEIHLPRYQVYGTPPQVPSDLAASGGSKQVSLSWLDNSPDEAEFVLERRTDSQEFERVALIGEGATNHVDSGLQPGMTYTYRIMARNAAGDSSYSFEATATTTPPPLPPAGPTNLRLVEVLADRVVLEWEDQSTAEDRFELQVSVQGAPYQGGVLVGPNTIRYTLTGLVPLTMYRFRVRAANDVGPSEWIESIQVTTLPEIIMRWGERNRVAAMLYYEAPSGAACTTEVSGTGTGVGTFTGPDGVRARQQILSGLSPVSHYDVLVRCEGASASGAMETPPEQSSGSPVVVGATAPIVKKLDNFVVEAGLSTGSLVPVGSIACTTGPCQVEWSSIGDQTQWVRYKWCRNRDTDPQCTNPANELRRSLAQPLIQR